jgi:RNA polymerase sigma factor (TIGR02999 family)
MDQEESGDVTKLLVQFRRGEREAEAKLMTLVYNELHRLAIRYMRRERQGHSLQPTALVHEAYLRLIKQQPKSWENRAHFFAISAILMRQILVDSARRHRAGKRGDGKPHANIDDPLVQRSPRLMLDPRQSEDLIALDDAMTALSKIHCRQSRIVELRFFAGMSTQEVADALEISVRTVDREWAAAQAWLYSQMRPLA